MWSLHSIATWLLLASLFCQAFSIELLIPFSVSSRDTEILHTEQLLRVGPHPLDGKSCCPRQPCKLLYRILVRTLLPDPLPQLEANLDLPNAHCLVGRLTQSISIRLWPG